MVHQYVCNDTCLYHLGMVAVPNRAWMATVMLLVVVHHSVVWDYGGGSNVCAAQGARKKTTGNHYVGFYGAGAVASCSVADGQRFLLKRPKLEA